MCVVIGLKNGGYIRTQINYAYEGMQSGRKYISFGYYYHNEHDELIDETICMPLDEIDFIEHISDKPEQIDSNMIGVFNVFGDKYKPE